VQKASWSNSISIDREYGRRRIPIRHSSRLLGRRHAWWRKRVWVPVRFFDVGSEARADFQLLTRLRRWAGVPVYKPLGRSISGGLPPYAALPRFRRSTLIRERTPLLESRRPFLAAPGATVSLSAESKSRIRVLPTWDGGRRRMSFLRYGPPHPTRRTARCTSLSRCPNACCAFEPGRDPHRNLPGPTRAHYPFRRG